MKCLQIHKMRESTSFHISEEKYMTRISFDWTSRPPVWQLIYVCILGLSALIIWYQYVARPPPYLRMFSSWKMVTINTTDLNSAPTKTAVFIKFLIKISFLPFSLDDNRKKIRFKFLSRKTLIYLTIYCGGFILLQLFFKFTLDGDTTEKISARNKLETFSVFSPSVCCLAIMFPLILSNGLNNLNIQLVWDRNMPFPTHGGKTIISYFGTVGGSNAAILGYFLSLDLQYQAFLMFAIFSLLGERELIIVNIIR